MHKSLYEIGITESHATAGDLGLISTPAAQLARLESIRQMASGLERDVRAYVVPAELSAQWSTWRANFDGWIGQLRAYQPSWVDRMWGATADQIETYARELGQMRADLARWPGARVTGPAPTEPPPKPNDTVKTIGITVAGGVLTFAAIWLISKALGGGRG